jgi:quinol monooxygenase YgiN
MHFVVRFEPRPGCEAAFREVLLRVLEPSRAEPGCLAMQAFASLREPRDFAIHSVWRDEAAFETHSQQPHTVAFVAAAERLLTHPIAGLRGEEIGAADPAVDRA